MADTRSPSLRLGLVVLGTLLSCTSGSGRYARVADIGVRPFEVALRDLRLPSGLRVLIEEDHRSPMVGLLAVVGSGAAAEPAGKAGLANLTARLSLRARSGPGALSRRELYERAGAARVGAEAGLDQTVLYTFAPRAALPELLRLEAARLGNPVEGVDADALARERAILRSELEAAREAGDLGAFLPAMQAALFPPQHPYAHPPAGTEETLGRIALGDVQDFAHWHFQPENVSLLVLGDVDASQVAHLLDQTLPQAWLGDPTHPVRPLVRALPARPPDPPPAPAELARLETPLGAPEIWLGWTLPSRYHQEVVPADLLADVLAAVVAQTPRGREELSREMQPPPSGHAAPAALGPDQPSPMSGGSGRIRPSGAPVGPPPSSASPATMADFFAALSGLAPPQEDPDIEDVQAFKLDGAQAAVLVCRVKLRTGAHPLYSAEHVIDRMRVLWYRTGHPEWVRYVESVDLTRTALLSRIILDSEDPIARAFQTAAYAQFAADARLYKNTLEPIAWADAGHIEDFSWSYLRRKRARMLYLVPSAAGAPVAGAGAGTRAPAASAPGGPVSPSAPPPPEGPAPLGMDTVVPLETGAFRTLKLPNGVEVILARRPGIPVMTLGLLLGGGKATERPLGVVEVAAHVAQVGHRYGKPSDFGAQPASDAAPDALTYELRAGADHVGKMLAILSDRVKNHWATRGSVLEFRKYVLPVLRRKEQAPAARADLAFWQALYGDHPYARRASADDLSRVDAAAVERWLRQTYRPDNAVVAVVGDFDLDRAQSLAEYWLADWRSEAKLPEGTVRYEPQPRGKEPPPPERPRGSQVLVTDRPGARQAELRFGCLLPETTDERRAVAYDLAAALLERRLARAVRDEMGAGSEVRAAASLLGGGTASLVVQASFAAEALPPLLARLRAGRDELEAGRLDDAELESARRAVAHEYALRYTTTQALERALLETRKRGFPLDALARYPGHLAALGRGEVTAAFAACRDADVLSILGQERQVRDALGQAGWR